MNLIIDIGNTRTKAGLFNKGVLVSTHVFQNDAVITELSRQFTLSQIKKCITASVTENNEAVQYALQKTIPQTILYSPATRVPVKNLYVSAETLGSDRIPTVVAAHAQYKGNDCLVVDAGTCVKYNFINKEGEFLGGAISPGLTMRFKALHNFTARLPLIESDEEYTTLIGTDTRGSILSGVQTGISNEIDMTISMYKKKYPGIHVFLTGGDARLLAKRLKNSIFTDPDLVLKGLNIILEFNAKD